MHLVAKRPFVNPLIGVALVLLMPISGILAVRTHLEHAVAILDEGMDATLASAIQPEEFVTVQRRLCMELNGDNTEAVWSVDILHAWDNLRRSEIIHTQSSVHDQLLASIGCSTQGEKRPPLTEVGNTGKGGSSMMRTDDKLFFLKEVLSVEQPFWEEHALKFFHHWSTHPDSAMTKYFAMVNSQRSSDSEDAKTTLLENSESSKHPPRLFLVMLNAWGGIADASKDVNAKLFDIKGSGRKCSGADCGSAAEFKELDLHTQYPKGLGLFAGKITADDGTVDQQSQPYQTFRSALEADVLFLMQLHAHDYSLVMRITTSAHQCPHGFVAPWQDSMNRWATAPKWEGAGSEFCAFQRTGSTGFPGRALRVSAVLLDYLQDATTIHNRLASRIGVMTGGSKIDANPYGLRFLKFTFHHFLPFAVYWKKMTLAQFGQDDDPYADNSDIEEFWSEGEALMCLPHRVDFLKIKAFHSVRNYLLVFDSECRKGSRLDLIQRTVL